MTRLLVLIAMLVPIVAAAEPSKDECVEAHSRGQDAKEQGKLTLARKLFLSCAQSACPQLVSNDCARFADELGRQQPSVTLAARDGSGNDLPDTSVYIDDVLVATRLDDGRPHDLDPGKHTVRFENAGHGQTMTIVLGNGEQGRTVAVVFGAKPQPSATPHLAAREDGPRITHPTGSRALMIGGVALTVAGAAFGAYELTRVPSNCSISTNQCAAAPGDPAFGQAQSAVHDANLAWFATGVGLAAAIGGTIWYFTGAHEDKERVAVAPWVSASSGGLAFGGAW